MKKMIRLASMAAAVLLMAACTQEELVNQPVEKNNNGMTAMSFSARVPNMTRTDGNASPPTGMADNNFGVYSIKTGSDGTTKTIVMNNYQVKFTTSDPGTGSNTTWPDGSSHVYGDEGWSYWYYEGLDPIGGTDTKQTLKYWDDNATKYDFYAYFPHTKTVASSKPTLGDTDKSEMWYADEALQFTMKATAINTAAPGYTADGYPFMAYTGVEKSGSSAAFSHADVPFAFKHFNSKVNIQFYTTITSYDVKITDEIVLSTKTDDDQVNTACYAVINGTTGDPHVANPTLGVLSQSFTNPTPNTGDKLPTSLTKYGAGTSGTTYFCMPSSTEAGKENGDLKVYVKYDLINGSETIHKDATVNLAKETYTRWAQNQAYLYIFKITANDLHPIVFDGISVSDYEKNDFSGHEFPITAL